MAAVVPSSLVAVAVVTAAVVPSGHERGINGSVNINNNRNNNNNNTTFYYTVFIHVFNCAVT